MKRLFSYGHFFYRYWFVLSTLKILLSPLTWIRPDKFYKALTAELDRKKNTAQLKSLNNTSSDSLMTLLALCGAGIYRLAQDAKDVTKHLQRLKDPNAPGTNPDYGYGPAKWKKPRDQQKKTMV